jgi:hypothetical protein
MTSRHVSIYKPEIINWWFDGCINEHWFPSTQPPKLNKFQCPTSRLASHFIGNLVGNFIYQICVLCTCSIQWSFCSNHCHPRWLLQKLWDDSKKLRVRKWTIHDSWFLTLETTWTAAGCVDCSKWCVGMAAMHTSSQSGKKKKKGNTIKKFTLGLNYKNC